MLEQYILYNLEDQKHFLMYYKNSFVSLIQFRANDLKLKQKKHRISTHWMDFHLLSTYQENSKMSLRTAHLSDLWKYLQKEKCGSHQSVFSNLSFFSLGTQPRIHFPASPGGWGPAMEFWPMGFKEEWCAPSVGVVHNNLPSDPLFHYKRECGPYCKFMTQGINFYHVKTLIFRCYLF